MQKSLGQSHQMSLILGGVNIIVYSIFAAFSWLVIERIGRHKLFLAGTVGQMASVTTFACQIPDAPAAAKSAAVSHFLYIATLGAA
jgi:hypothetical protein